MEDRSHYYWWRILLCSGVPPSLPATIDRRASSSTGEIETIVRSYLLPPNPPPHSRAIASQPSSRRDVSGLGILEFLTCCDPTVLRSPTYSPTYLRLYSPLLELTNSVAASSFVPVAHASLYSPLICDQLLYSFIFGGRKQPTVKHTTAKPTNNLQTHTPIQTTTIHIPRFHAPTPATI